MRFGPCKARCLGVIAHVLVHGSWPPPQPVNQQTGVPLGVERAHVSWQVLLPSHPLTGPQHLALVLAPPAPSPVPPLPVSPGLRRPLSGHSLQNKGSSLAPSTALREAWLAV